MARFLGVCRYKGSKYKGWQIQPIIETVQGIISDAISSVLGTRILVHGSGRTDAGVHAFRQFFHVDLHPHDEILLKNMLNRILPQDIVVLGMWRVSSMFHARFSAKAKWYRYVIYLQDSSFENIIWEDYVWAFRVRNRELFIEHFRQLAVLWKGKYDFAFMAPDNYKRLRTEDDFERSIYYSNAFFHGSVLVFDVIGSGFFNKMVRRMVGAMVQKASDPNNSRLSIEQALHQGCAKYLGEVVAPAKGLFLMNVFYGQCSYIKRSLEK